MFAHSKQKNCLLAAVELKSGKKLEAGLVVVGVGAIPNTEMFKGQLDLLEDKPGGVKVLLRSFHTLICCSYVQPIVWR